MGFARKLPADKKIAQMVADGKSSQSEVARKLGVTPAAICKAVQRASAKVDVPEWVHPYLRDGYARITLSRDEFKAAEWARRETRRAAEIAVHAGWVDTFGRQRETTPAPSVFESSIRKTEGGQ